MAASKRRRRGKTNNNIYTIIICALGLILLILCIILISRSCSGPEASNASPDNSASGATGLPNITASPSPAPTQNTFATLTAAATLSASSDGASTQSAAATQSATPEQTPQPTPEPINLSSDQVLALHITVDTGYSKPGNEIFDDYYALSSDYEMSMDAGNIKVVVFISDYRGNSTVRFFENMTAACIFSSFTFSGDEKTGTLSPEPAAKEMSIEYDKAGTANIRWNGQSVAALIDGEADKPYEMSYTSAGKTVKLRIENLGIMEKNSIFP